MAPADRSYTAVVASNGTAVVRIRPSDGISTWTISQLSVELGNAPTGAICDVRKNGYLVSPAIPTGDTVAGDPPTILQPSDTLTVEWAGCTPGTSGRVLMFFDDGSR